MEYKKIDAIYTKLLQIQHGLNENLISIAKNHGLNSTELMIYLDIKSNPETDLNALCDRLGLKKSTASKTLNKLVEEGFVKREADLNDYRRLSLTHVDLDKNLCKEETLFTAFKGVEKHKCSLEQIEKSLDHLIAILKQK